MNSTLLLFDLDGTLVRGSKASRFAFGAALSATTGCLSDLTWLNMSGKTDGLILREIMDHLGPAAATLDVPQFWQTYLGFLGEGLAREPGSLCPGVGPLLDRLVARPDVHLALGTGNLEAGARLKLAPHGLNPYFATGGFGSDAVDRAEVIAAGIAKARALYGLDFDRIAVVGDTPRDVACAAANGAHSIGVATGRFSVAELSAAGATAAMADLSRAEEFVELIASLPTVSDPPGSTSNQS